MNLLDLFFLSEIRFRLIWCRKMLHMWFVLFSFVHMLYFFVIKNNGIEILARKLLLYCRVW